MSSTTLEIPPTPPPVVIVTCPLLLSVSVPLPTTIVFTLLTFGLPSASLTIIPDILSIVLCISPLALVSLVVICGCKTPLRLELRVTGCCNAPLTLAIRPLALVSLVVICGCNTPLKLELRVTGCCNTPLTLAIKPLALVSLVVICGCSTPLTAALIVI